MISEQTLLELLLSCGGLFARQIPAPRPPWWGRGLRRTLAVVFAAIGRLGFDLQVRGLEQFSNSPGTLIVCNHKTDFDIILLAPTLYWSHRGRGPIGRLAFVAAERMFQQGYFSNYLLPRPRWLSRLLYPVNLSAALQALRTYPIPHARDRKLGAQLADIMELKGNLTLGEIFRGPPEEILPGAPPGAHITEVLGWSYHQALYQEHDYSIFTPHLERKLRAQHFTRILSCLGRFAAILDEGDAVYLAPEGELEIEGNFEEIKAGLARMVQMSRREMVLLPVNLTYDLMTTGRRRVFLTVGAELRGLQSWSRERLDDQVERAISRLGTVTLGQLASTILQAVASEGESSLAEGFFKEQIQREAARLAFKEGYRVDERLLREEAFERCWQRFCAYCRRRKLLEWQGERISFARAQVLGTAGADGEEPVSPWVYSANELATIIAAHKKAAAAPEVM